VPSYAGPEEDAVVLRSASRGGFSGVIQLLGENKACVRARDEYGRTLLHHADKLEDASILERLKNLGVDFNAKDKFGRTALHYAAMSGSASVIKELVRLGARVNEQNDLGFTSAWCAALLLRGDIVRLLVLELGASTEIKPENCRGSFPMRINYGKRSSRSVVLTRRSLRQ